MKFKKHATPIEDLFVIEPKVFGDDRGFFMEAYNKRDFSEIDMKMNFVQDNQSKSQKGVLRGLHLQTKHLQGKLVRVIRGSVYDVAVDLRKDSPTYKQHYGLILSEENKLIYYVPEGFAHGFLTLEDNTEFMYKVTEFYCPKCDNGFIWNDPDIGIKWPFVENNIEKPILSDKDRNLPFLSEM